MHSIERRAIVTVSSVDGAQNVIYHILSRTGPHREVNPPGFTAAGFSEVRKKILACLYFRAIKDRYEVVAEAHQRTFEWLFEDTKSTSRP